MFMVYRLPNKIGNCGCPHINLFYLEKTSTLMSFSPEALSSFTFSPLAPSCNIQVVHGNAEGKRWRCLKVTIQWEKVEIEEMILIGHSNLIENKQLKDICFLHVLFVDLLLLFLSRPVGWCYLFFELCDFSLESATLQPFLAMRFVLQLWKDDVSCFVCKYPIDGGFKRCVVYFYPDKWSNLTELTCFKLGGGSTTT